MSNAYQRGTVWCLGIVSQLRQFVLCVSMYCIVSGKGCHRCWGNGNLCPPSVCRWCHHWSHRGRDRTSGGNYRGHPPAGHGEGEAPASEAEQDKVNRTQLPWNHQSELLSLSASVLWQFYYHHMPTLFYLAWPVQDWYHARTHSHPRQHRWVGSAFTLKNFHLIM